MPIYDMSPPNTSDMKEVLDYLSKQERHLSHILSNIDEENLSDKLFDKINDLSDRLKKIEDKINSVSGN